MKSAKTILIATLAVGTMLACSSPVCAQDDTNTPPAGQLPPGGKRGTMSIDRLTKMLNLTDTEVPQVQAALNDMSQQIGAMRADTSLSKEDRRSKMKSLREAFIAQMKTILTPEQFAEFKKMSHHHRKAPPADDSGTTSTSDSGTTPPQN